MFKRRFLLLALTAVVLLAAGVAVWFVWPRKTALTLDVSGTPGLTIKGTCEVDGKSQDLTGTVPIQFVLEGYRVTYSLVSSEDSGEFRLWAVIRKQSYGSAGSGSPPTNGVRGWVKSSWWGSPPTHWIEAFDQDQQPRWLSPPP